MRTMRTGLLIASLVLGLSAVANAQDRQTEVTVRNENLGTCKVQVQVLQNEQPVAVLLVQPDAESTKKVTIDPSAHDFYFKVFGLGCPFFSYTYNEHVDPRTQKVTLIVAQNPSHTWLALATVKQ
jgi:hypothetical protein